MVSIRRKLLIAPAHIGLRRPHGTEGASLDGSQQAGKGADRRLSRAHAAAARRLPPWPAGDCSTPHAIILASLLPAAWDRRVPETRSDKPAKNEVQVPSNRLFPWFEPRKTDRWTDTDFLEALIKAHTPYKIYTVMTDNDIQFTDLSKNCLGLTGRWRVHNE